ncbi:TolC family protein [Chlorobaculum sp. MV4-Y]|jgi:outer membrane protein|uniref:TolC family protein n=1 Tax=Chlorobaculum sp. MV4-Y TaxID=2976335 RepID=UPI0021AF19AC|nr:TolC family protein [Chlorobaculum sp. MV4-Y]UWX58282.1 TolC family protein [Chlorobaculum sp. MV4-Y]
MMNKSVFTLLILFFLPVLTIHAENQPTKTLSLHECITIALNNASSVKKAENNLHLEGVDLLRSYGNFLPKVTSSASYVPRSVSRSYTSYSPLYGGGSDTAINMTSRSSTVDISLTASLNLFNGLSDYAALQAALDRKKAAGFTLQRAKETIAYDVTQHYYQVLLDKELLDIARENLKTSKDLLTLTNHQFNIGLKSITDLYQQQAEASNGNLAVINAENQLRRSKLELVRRLRIDPAEEIALEPVDTAVIAKLSPELDIEALSASSLRQRADLRAQDFERDAARQNVRQAAGARLPRLDLAFTMSSGAIDSYKTTMLGNTIDYAYPPVSKQLENGIDHAISLNLAWTIFDGFMTRYNVELAKVASRNSQLDYEELKDGIEIDLKQVAGDYRAAFTRIESARESLKASESAAQGITRKYDLGASNFVELSSARAALFNARSTLTQALYNLALQKALLDYTSGIGIEEVSNASSH